MYLTCIIVLKDIIGDWHTLPERLQTPSRSLQLIAKCWEESGADESTCQMLSTLMMSVDNIERQSKSHCDCLVTELGGAFRSLLTFP